MPLSVPLLLVPGEPDRHYTVHLHRVRWSVGAVSVPLTADHLAALGTNAERGLRMVSECIAAELSDADVEVTENPDGSAEAVARVLCTEDECAAVAERYRRDADEDVEAEAARAWAATRLQDQTVELLKLRAELEKTTPGKTAPEMLAALLAIQQERTGGATDRIVLWLDEAAHLLRDNGLFTDRSPEGVRREMDRLIRRNRAPYPIQSGDEETASAGGRLDLDQALSLPTWAGPARGSMTPTLTAEGREHLDLPNAFHMAPEHLVRETETLARSVAAGETRTLGVRRLAELCGELARRHGAEPQPRPCPGGCTEDDDAAHDLVHRIGYRPRAVRAGEVRTARIILAPERRVDTLPAELPADDTAFVLVYREDTPGLALIDAIRAGDDEAARDAVTGALRWLTADGK
ncbi:hypothetical protein OG840_61650 [Streptomyces sp. NBC_01764]|uniref:hypothetical protein n=1 Tax=Streptomyces sp. NBC_01764 TaxID=2975935 RepID=UPI00224F5BDD|nr:hypothetical protein [Streptomyces sp. NBC_01764]MCX4411598.1 hypothetical protein [Streptomyces sp. NBC_01764]